MYMLVSQINIPFAPSMINYKRGKPWTQTFYQHCSDLSNTSQLLNLS